MYQKFSFVAIQIQMIKFLSHKHTSTSLASLYWKAGERTNLQKGTKISVPLFRKNNIQIYNWEILIKTHSYHKFLPSKYWIAVEIKDRQRL